MSWKIQAIVGERVCGSITRKMVLLNMASRANDDGTGVYASLPMIAGWCEVDARTVRRIVRDLEADGLIVQCGWKDVKNGKINEWRVDVHAVEQLPLYRDEVAAKRAAKDTPDTVSGVKRKSRKSNAYEKQGGHDVRADAKSARTHDPATPDTGPASSTLEPKTLFEEANASPNRGTVVQLRPGEGSEAFGLYVEAAKRAGWVVAKGKPSAKRQQAIRARLKENGGLPAWREQIALAERMPFLAGDNDRGWRMDLDFFASARGWSAISEEKYARAEPRQEVTTYDQRSGYPRTAGRGTAYVRERRDPVFDGLVDDIQPDDTPLDLGRLESYSV